MQELPALFFNHYRDFLKSCFESRKRAQPSLTLGAFSQFLGFGTANYLGLVMNGKRNLTTEQIHRISQALKLTFDETLYFEALVLNDQSRSNLEKKYYSRRLQECRRAKSKSIVKLPAKLLLEEWYFPVVALLADGAKIDQAIERMQKALPFSKNVIEALLEKLIKSEILVFDDSICRLNHRHQVFHDTQSRSARHKAFLRSQLKISSRMLEKNYERGARFYAHTFTIATDDLPYYEDRIRSLISEFTERSDQSSVDEVVQLNAQLFLVTKDSIGDLSLP